MLDILKIGILDDSNDLDEGLAENEPDIWFNTLPEAVRILNPANLSLLNTIRLSKPGSVEELGQMTGRSPRVILETLRVMERHGLVNLRKHKDRRLQPEVKYSSMQLKIDVVTLAGHRRARSG